MPHDLTITDRDIPLAIRDYGGEGPPLLLLHGLGGTVDVWDQIAPDLEARTIAMDLRGHGRSGDGPWDWQAVLDDIEAVVAHVGLDAPIVVGHSMGGLLAMLWAQRHSECPAVVNLDGLRSAENHPENYPDMDPDTRDRWLEGLKGFFDDQEAAAAAPLDEEQRSTAPERATTIDVNGNVFLRPNADVLAAVRYDPAFVDSIPVLRASTTPTAVMLATRDLPGMESSELMAAFRRGVRRDLIDLPEVVEVTEVDASHAMVYELPHELAGRIGAFVAQRTRA